MAKEGGFIDGFSVRERDDVGIEVPQLLFVDDILIFFCDASKEKLRVLELGLHVVKAIFG